MLKAAENLVLRALGRQPWSANVGVARTLIALSGMGTLLASSVATLIRPAAGVDQLFCVGPASISIWCLSPPVAHEGMRWICIVLLAVCASGWRPRLTAIPLWWVLFGNQASLTVVDGGDQIAAVLALLLIPHSLTDVRKWHWRPADQDRPASHPYQALFACVTLIVVQVQVAYIYINACLAKLGVPEWLDGSAIYYWLRDPMFGPAGALRSLSDLLFAQPIPVATVTWGTLFLEFGLGIAILLPRRARLILLPLGVLLHVAIAVTMGLWSFAFTMWAALILLLWPDGDLPALAAKRIGHVQTRRRDRTTELSSSFSSTIL